MRVLFLTKCIRGERSRWSCWVVLLSRAFKLAMDKFSLRLDEGCQVREIKISYWNICGEIMEVNTVDGVLRPQRLITVHKLFLKLGSLVAGLLCCQKSNFICRSVGAERRLSLVREGFLRPPFMLSRNVLILSCSEQVYLAFFTVLQCTLKLSGPRPKF